MSSFPRYSRPAILDRVPPDGHHVLEASAGTGKTFTIEHLVVERVLGGTPLSKMLVVTFTERAAAELRERIRALLNRMVRQARRPVPKQEKGPAWELTPEALQRLEAALSALDGSAIATIHSFCQRLLTENAFAHRRLFNQRLVDGPTVFDEVLREYLRGPLGTNPVLWPLVAEALRGGSGDADAAFTTLADQLKTVVEFTGTLEPELDAPALVALMQGLPKRLPTVEDLVAVVPKGSVGVMERMARPLLGVLQAAREVDARSEHGRDALLVALSGLWAKDPEGGKYRLWQYVVERLEKAKELDAGLAKFGKTVQALASAVPQPDSLLAYLCRAPLQERLKAHKAAQGLYDFGDMLHLVAESLEGDGAADIIATLRERYAFVFIDEFQDTDPVQWKVFSTLFTGQDCATRLVLIGDPKQAIYGFRSADVATYLAARDQLVDAPVPLKENFRSSERMIAAYNQVLTQEPADEGKARAEDKISFFRTDPLITYRDEVAVTCGDRSVRLVGRDGTPWTPVQLRRFRVSGTGAQHIRPKLHAYLARDIRQLLSPTEGPTLYDKHAPHGRPLRADDIYVLGRSHSDTSAVVEALVAEGIPAALFKQGGLLDGREAEDLSAVLAAVLAPHDRRARARAWLTPFFGLTPGEVELLREAPNAHPLVAPLVRWNELAGRRDLTRLFAALVEETGLLRRAALLPALETVTANTLRLLELLAEEGRRRHEGLPELWETLQRWRAGTAAPAQEDAELCPAPTDRPAVKVMTMHASKGLEAAVVFLCGGTSEFPNKSGFWQFNRDGERRGWLGSMTPEVDALATEYLEAEDERLMYVALTRAKVRLVLPLYETTKAPPGVRAPLCLKGCAERLNQRLFTLLDRGLDESCFELLDASGAPLDAGAYEGCLSNPDGTAASAEDEEQAPPAAAQEGLTRESTDLAAWAPLPQALDGSRPDEARLHGLARERLGPVGSSFTQLSRLVEEAAEEKKAEDEVEARAPEPLPDDALPSSAAMGTFLHDVLEALDFAHVAKLPSREAFEQDEAVRAIVEAEADEAGVAPARRGAAYRLLWAALRTPLNLGGVPVPSGVASAPKVLREAEFWMPVPEDGHRLLGKVAADAHRPFEVRRGLFKGFIDLLFEWQGRVYFADWKSNRLTDGSVAGVAAYTAEHYRLQVVLYAVAVVRILRIQTPEAYEARFGGALYLYLREVEKSEPGQPARGAYFHRPSWEELQGWEQELLTLGVGREEVAA